MRNIFIDGYNVINSWPELNKIKDYSFESARVKLVEIIQNYAAYKGYKAFIVFDAHMVKGSIEKREKLQNVIVIFTKEGETADSFIERYINLVGRKIEVCVVTSDFLEQQLTFQRGAIRMSSMEFYNDVIATGEKIKISTKKNIASERAVLEDRLSREILEKLEKIRRSD